jgi:phosphate transport system substrate-binding protein
MRVLIAILCVAGLGACSRRDSSPDSKGGRAVIQNKGSDTLVNVAQTWAEAYKTVEPNVAVAVSGGGSGTGVSALLNGTVDIANSSRPLKDKELELAKKKGIAPKEHIVGYDALAIFLHKENPLEKIAVTQLAEIYGENGTITKWSQLGVQMPGCPSDEIIVVSRQNNSGTYEYFKEHILGEKRDFRLGTKDMHGSKDVGDLVAKTPCAIGYSGLAYLEPHVKAPCISPTEGGVCVAPSMASAIDRSYPVARPLFMYTNGEPTGAVKAYLDWIVSDKGQCIIQEKGYAPIRPVKC